MADKTQLQDILGEETIAPRSHAATVTDPPTRPEPTPNMDPDNFDPRPPLTPAQKAASVPTSPAKTGPGDTIEQRVARLEAIAQRLTEIAERSPIVSTEAVAAANAARQRAAQCRDAAVLATEVAELAALLPASDTDLAPYFTVMQEVIEGTIERGN